VKFVPNVCPKCDAEIFVDAAEGLCTACLLETGLGLFREVNDSAQTDESVRVDVNVARKRNGAPDKTSTPGSLGDYELLEEIGCGGQGVVYRARQKSLNRTVALKVLATGRWTKQPRLKRFRLEAETAASLDDPNIVPIYEIGECDGSCYFSMKLVEGAPLDQLVRRELLPIRRTAELIAKLARAVHYAHQRGILHRDIKPGNILIDAKGEPHLTDFGLARLTETESTVTRTIETLGTPSYMAPEQALGSSELTAATDVYGLGAVLYHLLTGHPPFAGGTTYDTIRLLLETEPRHPRLWNPKADRDLATICLKCLEKNPQRRYPSALALSEDLERWLKHRPIRARRTGVFGRGKKWVRRNPTMALLILSVAGLAAAVGWNVWKSELVPGSAAAGIAVLPFENLSEDKENAFFADGVQDDILNKLAKIADLKVISRTSVMEYRGNRNIREIGKALRVSHVLEGRVRKTGARLYLHAQLIDTRTDAQVWGKQYDLDLNHQFTIQGEIAKKIAQQLHAKISAAEALTIAQPITTNLTAFDLYTRARNLLLMKSLSASARANFLQAVDLLNAAVARDPAFFQAYSQLASAHGNLYFLGYDHSPARLALAETAIHAAFRLRPDAGEAHLAQAENLYQGQLDYQGALAELEIASQSLPNDPKVFELKGYIQRRQGKQEEALRNLERAVELDPRNALMLQQMALSYELVRRYPEAKLVWDRVLAIEPNDMESKIARALVEFNWKADTRPLHLVIDSIRSTNPAVMASIADVWFILALAERDAIAAQNALIALGDTPLRDGPIRFNRSVVEGMIARLAKADSKAQVAFTAARVEQEKMLQTQPDYGPPLCVLGLIDAALGRKADALREGRRAVELLQVEKDALNGTRMVSYFAMIAAWVGEKDLACEQLAIAIGHSSDLSYGQLKLLPFWDPLRGEPCFEKIVASLAPK
jgi:TolB-like protein/Tfp pilus assembly protein PilF/predicted Ser/Thr protein kinase